MMNKNKKRHKGNSLQLGRVLETEILNEIEESIIIGIVGCVFLLIVKIVRMG